MVPRARPEGRRGSRRAGRRATSHRTLVIIPTYNGWRTCHPLIVGRVRTARPDVHILVVDDGSPDGTGHLADELAAAHPDRIQVMHPHRRTGWARRTWRRSRGAWNAATSWWRWMPTAAAMNSCIACSNAIDNGADLGDRLALRRRRDGA